MICAAGFYWDPFPEIAEKASVEEIRDAMIAEVETGADGTDVRCGVIKVGTAREPSEPAERLFKAAAAASAATGAPVITHTSSVDQAAWHVRVLEDAGMDMSHAVISHMGAAEDVSALVEVARSGAFMGIDKVSFPKGPTNVELADLVRDACDKGFERQTHPVVRHRAEDAAHALRRPRLLHGVPRFRADAGERGIPTATIELMLQDNPARMLRAGQDDFDGNSARKMGMMNDAVDPMLLACSAAGHRRGDDACCRPCPAAAQTSRVAEVANYQGADREQRLVEGAKREGSLTLYSNAPTDDNTALVAPSRRNTASRSISTARARRRFASASSTKRGRGASTSTSSSTTRPAMEALTNEKLLVEVKSPHVADLMPQAIAADRSWVGFCLNVLVQAYNTNLIKKADLPKTYADLLDPKWKGKIAIEADNSDWFAGLMGVMGEDKGLKLFRDIAAD